MQSPLHLFQENDMQSKSVVLKLALIGAVLATLQSAAALASDPTDPAEAPIVVVAPGEEVNENGEMNNIDLAMNDVDDGAKNDTDDGAKDDDTSNMHDGAHGAVVGGKENTAESVQDQQEQAHNESGQKDN
jgi:hypothetical protein